MVILRDYYTLPYQLIPKAGERTGRFIIMGLRHSESPVREEPQDPLREISVYMKRDFIVTSTTYFN